MVKNPLPMVSKNPVDPAKKYSVDLFTLDNTVILKSEDFIYVCPSGMWQAMKVRELD